MRKGGWHFSSVNGEGAAPSAWIRGLDKQGLKLSPFTRDPCGCQDDQRVATGLERPLHISQAGHAHNKIAEVDADAVRSLQAR